MYKIQKYSYAQAEKLNVIIKPAKNPLKKIDVFNKKGEYICSIGATGYMDFPTYIIKKGYKYAKERQRLYKLRHKKDINNKNTAGYYAGRILW